MDKIESNFERIKREIQSQKNNTANNVENSDIKNVNKVVKENVIKSTNKNVKENVLNNNKENVNNGDFQNVKFIVKVEKEEIPSRETIYLKQSIADKLEEYSVIVYGNKKSKSKLANILLEFALKHIEIVQ